MYSYRHYPRGKCNPNNDVVLYFKDDENRPVDEQKYEWVSHEGFGTMGRWAEVLTKGIYTFTIVNQGYQTKAADLSISFYASEKLPVVNDL